VEGARPHRGGVPGGGAIEIERPGEPAAVEDVQVLSELGGEALVLVGVDAEQAKRLDELLQVIARRRDEQGDAAWAENPGDLSGVTRGEDIQDNSGGAVPKRQGRPDIGSDGSDTRMEPRRPAQSGLRDVEGEPKRVREAVQQAPEIPTRARSEVDDERRARLPESLGHPTRDRFGDWLEVACFQEPLAGVHHVGGVAAVGTSGSGEQAQVALAGHVEGVARLAGHRFAAASTETRSAVRAAQQRQHLVERGHSGSLAAGQPSSQRRPCSTIRSGAKRVDSLMNPRRLALTRVHAPARSTQPPAVNQ
jgi:hypothetical protein